MISLGQLLIGKPKLWLLAVPWSASLGDNSLLNLAFTDVPPELGQREDWRGPEIILSRLFVAVAWYNLFEHTWTGIVI